MDNQTIRQPALNVVHLHDLDDEVVTSLLMFHQHDGTLVRKALPRDELAEPKKVNGLLARSGANIAPQTKSDLEPLQTMTAANTRYQRSRPGWVPGGRYAWPLRIHREAGRRVGFPDGDAARRNFGPLFLRKRLTFLWRGSVGRRALTSSYMIVAIGSVLAGPLMRFSGLQEGFILNFVGPSGTGKSLCLIAAQSIVGRARRSDLWSWDMSTAGLEQLAHLSDDLTLVIDDTERDRTSGAQRAQGQRAAAFMVAGGGRRVRAKTYEQAHGTPKPRQPLIVLSSGERSFAETARAGEEFVTAGATVRSIDVPVPGAAQGGVFDRLPAGTMTTDHAQQLEQAIAREFGSPFQLYLQHLEAAHGDLPERVGSLVSSFVTDWTSSIGREPSSSELRVAQKFGLILAGLIIGREARAFQCPPTLAFAAVTTCLNGHLRHRNQPDPALQTAVEDLRAALRDGQRTPILGRGDRPPANAVGFKRREDGKLIGIMTGAQIGAVVGWAQNELARLLDELDGRGALESGQGARTRPVKVAGSPVRCYLIRQSFWR